MASQKAVTSKLEGIRSRLTCSICNSLFEEPVKLKCLHTYCKKCLEKYVFAKAKNVSSDGTENRENEYSLKCRPGVCQHITQINSDNLDEQQTSPSIANLVSHLQRSDKVVSTDGVKCDECDEDDGSVFCSHENCNQALCENCCQHHNRSRKTKTHSTEGFLKPISELRSRLGSETFEGIGARVSWKCKIHTRQDAIIYCIDHDKIICRDCSICEPHTTCKKYHAKQLFGEHAAIDEHNFKERITDSIKETKEVVEKFSSSIESLGAMKQSLHSNRETKKAAVCTRHDQVVQMLKQQRDDLLVSIDAIVEKKEAVLNRQLRELQNIEEIIQESVTFSEEILDVGIPEEILSLMTDMTSQLKFLHDEYTPYDCTLRDSDIIKFTPNGALDLKDTAIGVVSADPHISEFTVEDLEAFKPIEGQETKFTVTCRDIIGNALPESSHEVLAVLLPKEGGSIRGAVTRQPQQMGKYLIAITPQNAGMHKLSITVRINNDNCHIKGSPFDINVIRPPNGLQQHAGNVISLEEMQSPWGLAANAVGEIAVSDTQGHCLFMLSPNGNLKGKIGKHGDGDCQFESPRGVAFSPTTGELVVVDRGNHRVQILTAQGAYKSKFGTKGGDKGKFFEPTGIAINNEGNIFITDYQNQRIQFFNAEGNHLLGVICQGQCGPDLGQVNGPYAVTFDDQNGILVTEREGGRVQVFGKQDLEGEEYKAITQFGSYNDLYTLEAPVGIAYDGEQKYVFVTEYHKGISVFTPDGHYISTYGQPGVEVNQLNRPIGLAVLPNHRLMVADCGNKRLLVFHYWNDTI